MKTIKTYILIVIVSLVMVIATAFLMTAADEPVRQAGRSSTGEVTGSSRRTRSSS